MTWEQNSSFSQSIPKYQLCWDSTSLGALKTCPRYYYYTLVGGFAPQGLNIHLVFGALYHGALERYDHAIASGEDHNAAILLAVDYAMKESWDDALNRPKAVLAEDPNKNRFTLIRTIVWYLEQFRDDPLRTVILANGKPAVELSFRFETDFTASSGEKILYCGHLDRVAEMGGESFIADRKTTKGTLSQGFFASFTPNNQFAGYMMAGRILLPVAPRKLIVDAAQIAIGFSRFERGIVEFSDSQIDEWYQGLGYYVKMAEVYAKDNFWPMNETSCAHYVKADGTGGCPFRSVCSKKSAGAREDWLRAGFVKRVWNPLEVRGDV